jgi:hypothetical protein
MAGRAMGVGGGGTEKETDQRTDQKENSSSVTAAIVNWSTFPESPKGRIDHLDLGGELWDDHINFQIHTSHTWKT